MRKRTLLILTSVRSRTCVALWKSEPVIYQPFTQSLRIH